MKKITIVCYVLCFLLGICVYQLIKSNIVKPPVKVETKTEVKYLVGNKKECRNKGGHFKIKPYFKNMFEKGYVEDEYSISCIKYYQEGNKSITETIFDYKI